MPHIFEAFVATSEHVEVIDGISFRLRRITMETLAEVGVSMMLATQPMQEEGAAPRRPSSAQVAASQDLLRRATAAAVRAVSVDGGATWSAARVVLALAPGQERDAAAAQGILLVHDLPPAMVQRLGGAAMEHATGGRAARQWLGSFRGADANPAGPAREEVREAAE